MSVVSFRRVPTDVRTQTGVAGRDLVTATSESNSPVQLDALIRNAFTSGMDGIKAAIEISVIEAVSRRLVGSGTREDNPFDAIYLLDLTQDALDKVDLEHISACGKHISDLSDHLQLSDGWDD